MHVKPVPGAATSVQFAFMSQVLPTQPLMSRYEDDIGNKVTPVQTSVVTLPLPLNPVLHVQYPVVVELEYEPEGHPRHVCPLSSELSLHDIHAPVVDEHDVQLLGPDPTQDVPKT
jgi:hypothetical protein